MAIKAQVSNFWITVLDVCDRQSVYTAIVAVIGGCVMLVPAYGDLFTRDTVVTLSGRGYGHSPGATERKVDGVGIGCFGLLLIAGGARTMVSRRRFR